MICHTNSAGTEWPSVKHTKNMNKEQGIRAGWNHDPMPSRLPSNQEIFQI